ncbi:hypothetical protein AJ80_08825 [Polytolypa hystricis UAMH7299]|uniref:Uncharacterized protein n=1 Tax=Polytolypa hystricis (strain UAMH7299) TaxID=1447883 RepID=A0A2B7X1G3_POLH7|nr:hypothetical protein AJ80_08825 [Polytolypa hystricis UAMH7299]
MAASEMREEKLGEQTQEIIDSLAEWLCTAEFRVVKEQSWELCTDKERNSRLKNLLAEPHVKDKVLETSRQRIVRISGPQPGNFGSAQGPAYIYPLRIHDTTRPSVGSMSLRVGWFLEVKNPAFKITPGADCLIILTVNSNVSQTTSAVGKFEIQ